MTELTDWLTAIGTVGAVIAALALAIVPAILKGKPKLRISLQRPQKAPADSYWHGTSTFSSGGFIGFKQLRVWVSNAGRREAKNCRAKLKITDPQLGGEDSPTEFTLPVFQFYTPEIVSPGGGDYHLLRPPNVDELTITVSPHSQEAFDLLFHFDRSPLCHPYSKSAFPLSQDHQYRLEVKVYADDYEPTSATVFTFKWDGTENGLPKAVY